LTVNDLRGFFNLDDQEQGLHRNLAPGVAARVFVGDRSMLSLATFAPNSESKIHCHPEEQWGVLLEGSGVRIQDGAESAVMAGDFWHTPGGVSHGFRAGAKGARILDIFSPPRQEYR